MEQLETEYRGVKVTLSRQPDISTVTLIDPDSGDPLLRAEDMFGEEEGLKEARAMLHDYFVNHLRAKNEIRILQELERIRWTKS